MKYFTSRVSPTQHDPLQGKRQNTYLEALEAHSGIKAILGHHLPKPITCRNCGSTWQNFEEKRIDVNIAIEMLADAQANRFDTAILISADSDLSAPIELPNQPLTGNSSPATTADHSISTQTRSCARRSSILNGIVNTTGSDCPHTPASPRMHTLLARN